MEKERAEALSPKAALLEEAEQAHRRIAAQREADIEEERRKKRLRERRSLAYLTFMKLYREQQERLLRRDTDTDAFYQAFLKSSLHVTESAVARLRGQDEAVASLFTADETEEQRTERESLQQELDIGRDEFGAIALSSCTKLENHRKLSEQLFRGDAERSLSRAMGRKGHDRAMHAMRQLRSGSTAELEQILKDGLVHACHRFSVENDPVNAIHWAQHANKILGIMTTHPVLFKDGASKELTQLALGVAAMGKMMRGGYEALLEVQRSCLSGEALPPERERLLHAQILLMQQVDARRSSDALRRHFAEGYQPKSDLPSERMLKLLDDIADSRTVQSLAMLNPHERSFALSDPSSRRILGESSELSRLFRLPEAAAERQPAPHESTPPMLSL